MLTHKHFKLMFNNGASSMRYGIKVGDDTWIGNEHMAVLVHDGDFPRELRGYMPGHDERGAWAERYGKPTAIPDLAGVLPKPDGRVLVDTQWIYKRAGSGEHADLMLRGDDGMITAVSDLYYRIVRAHCPGTRMYQEGLGIVGFWRDGRLLAILMPRRSDGIPAFKVSAEMMTAYDGFDQPAHSETRED
jgi:hypothetical protein